MNIEYTLKIYSPFLPIVLEVKYKTCYRNNHLKIFLTNKFNFLLLRYHDEKLIYIYIRKLLQYIVKHKMIYK